MSIEKAREFFKNIEAGGPVQVEYKALLLGCKGLSENETLGKIARFASAKGFEMSLEDINGLAAETKNRELSTEELNAVAGGWLCNVGPYYAGFSGVTRP